MATELEASKLTARLEAACTIETATDEEDSEELWTIPTSTGGQQGVLTKRST